METLNCILKHHGVAVESLDASQWCIPHTVIERSPVLRSLIADVTEESSFQLPAPKGYILAWIRALSTCDEDNKSVKDMAEAIMAADYLADEKLLKSLCEALGQVVGSYCLSTNPDKRSVEDFEAIPQMLQELSGPLVATVLRAAPVSLAQQLRRLPPSTHPHAMHAAYPKLSSESTLLLDGGDHDAATATLALNTIADSQESPLSSLAVSSIVCLATLQTHTIPDDFVKAFTRACLGVKDVWLDFRDFQESMTASAWVAGMDPSATEGMLCGLEGSTTLESLEVHSSEDVAVAAFLEGGGCARQLKRLKLDIEGPSSEAALQAMAACTALTHLTLKCSLSYCFVLAASLQCMTQLQELHLTLNSTNKAKGPVADAAANVRNSEQSGYTDPLLTQIRKPGIALNPLWLRYGFRAPGRYTESPQGFWRVNGPVPSTCPSITNTPSDDSDLLNDAIAHLPALTTLRLQGKWFQENPTCVERAPCTASHLQHCGINLPDLQPQLSDSLQMMLCGIDSLDDLQELTLSLRAPKKPFRVKGFWAWQPQKVSTLLDIIQKLNLHTVCAGLQLSVRPSFGVPLQRMLEPLKTLTTLRHLHLSRTDNAVGRSTVQRMLVPQNELVGLGHALVNLTYLKIGVSFVDTSPQHDPHHPGAGGRGGAGGRVAVGGRWSAQGRGRGGGGAPVQNTFSVSGLACALQSLTLLQHLSMYSQAPDAFGNIQMTAPDEGEIRALGEAMQCLTTLSKLSLRGSHLCSAPMCDCVAQLPALKILSLDGDFNASKGWSESTMSAFSNLRQLQRLTINRLHGSKLGLERVAQLLDAVAPAGELKALSVGWVLGAGSSAAIKKFAHSLKCLTGLQSLSLNFVRFVQHCGKELANSLLCLRQLRVLNIAMCELNGADTCAICQSLCDLQEIVRVNLCLNRLGEQDVEDVRTILKGCTRLHSVQLGLQMPFLQCPCCDYFTLPRWSWYHACLEMEPQSSVYLKVPEEFIERWLCPVCWWNSWEAPGAEDIESLLDKQTETNSITLREARFKFQEARKAGTVSDGIVCGRDEFQRFDERPRDVVLEDVAEEGIDESA